MPRWTTMFNQRTWMDQVACGTQTFEHSYKGRVWFEFKVMFGQSIQIFVKGGVLSSGLYFLMLSLQACNVMNAAMGFSLQKVPKCSLLPLAVSSQFNTKLPEGTSTTMRPNILYSLSTHLHSLSTCTAATHWSLAFWTFGNTMMSSKLVGLKLLPLIPKHQCL